MDFFGSKERVYSNDNKNVATIMGSLIVMVAIVCYTWTVLD